MTKRTYAVVLIPQEEGGFRVRVPALPEVNTQGKDRAQALERVVEAIEAAVEQRLEDGEAVPVGDDETDMALVEIAKLIGSDPLTRFAMRLGSFVAKIAANRPLPAGEREDKGAGFDGTKSSRQGDIGASVLRAILYRPSPRRGEGGLPRSWRSQVAWQTG